MLLNQLKLVQLKALGTLEREGTKSDDNQDSGG
jgi:hypothetical protein